MAIRVQRSGGTLGTEDCTIGLADGDALAGVSRRDASSRAERDPNSMGNCAFL